MARSKKNANQDVYVSFEPNVYRTNKAIVLNGQADLLRSMKYVSNLKVLTRQRQDLRTRLFKQVEMVVKEIARIEKHFPKPNLPGRKTKKIRESVKPRVSKDVLEVKRDFSKREAIDNELQDIKARLARLNN